MIIAIDPGTTHSAGVTLDASGALISKFYGLNADALAYVAEKAYMPHMAVEMVACYGMPVGAEVFQTCLWAGRFIERYSAAKGGATALVYRKDVKVHLCGSMRAADSNIRAALIDRFGPGKDVAVGRKLSPGPLFGVTGDMWAALAVAVTYYDSISNSTTSPGASHA